MKRILTLLLSLLVVSTLETSAQDRLLMTSTNQGAGPRVSKVDINTTTQLVTMPNGLVLTNLVTGFRAAGPFAVTNAGSASIVSPSVTISNLTSVFGAANVISSDMVRGTNASSGAAEAGLVMKLNASGLVPTTMLPASVFTTSYASTGVVITTAGSVQLTHGLGAAPKLVFLKLKNISGEKNYSIGDEVLIDPGAQDQTTAIGVSVVPTSTTIDIRFANSAAVFQILDKTTGARNDLDPTKWLFHVNAWQ